MDDVITGQALPRLAVDAQGNIAVIWYDSRHDPAHHLLEVFGTVSTDGGRTFSPNFRLTDRSFDADLGRFTNAIGQTDYYLGDFIGLAVANLDDDDVVQLTLPFDAHAGSALDAAVDAIREKFGTTAVNRTLLLGRDPGVVMPMLPD